MICRNHWHFYTLWAISTLHLKFYVILITKCHLVAPSCNFFITFWTFMVDRYLLNLLSYPILYKTSFFNVNGLSLLANCCFCLVDKNTSIYLICKNILTSFNHSSSMKNKLTSVVCSGTPKGSITLGNLNKTFAITWILPSLYTTTKSYSKNNNNHLDTWNLSFIYQVN